MNKERVATNLADKQCELTNESARLKSCGSVLAHSAGRLDDASLRKFFYEALSIVNNHPLTVDSISDPTSLEPLTPNHLLTMKSSVPLPPLGKFVKEDLYAKKWWSI